MVDEVVVVERPGVESKEGGLEGGVRVGVEVRVEEGWEEGGGG